MRTIVVTVIGCILLSACGKKNYSADTPLETVNSPSLFISSQNKYLYALDPAHGSEKWEFNLHGAPKATPVVVGKYLFVPTSDTLFKFDVNTGKLISKKADSPYVAMGSCPVTDGRLLYIASVLNNGTSVFAINPDNDAIMWFTQLGNSIDASLALYQDKLIVPLNNGTIYCISKNNGTPLWPAPGSGGSGSSSPVISPPYIYAGSGNNLNALNLNDGTPAWTYVAGNVINSSPIVYGGNIIFGCDDDYVYCVDSIAKDVRWKYKTFDRIQSSAAAYRNVVYIGGYDGNVYAINILNGELKWKFETGGLIRSSVLNVEGDIYIASFDKWLYKVDTSGSLKWKYDVNGPMESSPVLFDYNNNKTYYPSITGMYQY